MLSRLPFTIPCEKRRRLCLGAPQRTVIANNSMRPKPAGGAQIVEDIALETNVKP